MVDVNVNALADQPPTMAPPIHTDDQILPHIILVLIGKRNCYLDVEKSQINPIYKITVDILKHTNFFRAFTASSTIPSIYIQQFWDTRALTKIINLCLMGKTSGFERPRAPVLQILWGVVNRAHLDYARRIWGEFTQSIHTFIKDKRNLAQHTHEKKKATPIVIPSIRFTKLIIYHLQRKHKFHPIPDSPLHLPNEEPVLGYLKFSAKGTKREVFRMPIPGSLIIADIQRASYYQPGLVSKKRKPISSLRSVDESVAKDVPEKEPRVDDEEADVQRALEESLKNMYDVPQGPLPPVVIGEPESRKYQPLLEVPGKGKEKARSNPDEQAEGQAGPNPGNAEASQPMPSHVVHVGSDREHMDLDVADVSTQPPPEQIDEGFTAMAYPKVQENLKLTVEERVILEEPASSSRTLSSLQHLTKDLSFGDLFFSNKPSEADNDKATAATKAESMVFVTIQQDISSNSPMITLIIDLTSRPESPKVHQLLKATATETTTTTTTTTITILPPPSQQQQSTAYAMMMKRIGKLEHIMENLIQENKRLESPKVHQLLKATATETTTTTTTTITILPPPSQQQQSTAYAMMMKRIGELEHIMENLIQENKRLEQRLESHGAHLYTLEQLDIPHQVSKAIDKVVTDAVDWTMQAPLRNHFRDLPEADMKEILHQSRKKKKKSRESPKTPPGSPLHQPPPPHPPAGPSGASGSPGASGSSQVLPLPPPPPSTNQEDIRNAYIPKVNLRLDWWKPLEEERPATLKPAWSISSSDVPIPMNNWASTLASNYSSPPKDSLLAQTGDIAMFMDLFYKRRGITKLKPQDLEGPTFEIIKVFHPDVIHLQYQMEECHKLLTDSVDDSILKHNVSKPLPLGGPPDLVKSQFNLTSSSTKI
nr:histone deacetylase 14 [Tanacetum cinerariifolium]